MLDLLAAVGLIVIGIVVLRALAPRRVGVGARRRTTAPDDDPDFLRRLGEQLEGRPDDPDNDTGGPDTGR